MTRVDVITPNMMGNFSLPKREKGYANQKKIKVGQINFDEPNVQLTEEEARETQSVLAGIAFNEGVCDNEEAVPSAVTEVLSACGIFQPLGRRFPRRKAS